MTACMLLKHKRGITLVELLITITIFSIITALTVSIFLNVQKTERRFDEKYDFNAEVDKVVQELEYSLRFARTLITGTDTTVKFLDINNDTVVYRLRGDTLLRNQMRMIPLSVDSIMFVYTKTEETKKIVDFYLFDENRNGILEVDELNGILGINVYIDFLYPEQSVVKKMRLKKQIVVSFRNIQPE
jgi:prepilin-type N-terminal cleavage/methylation domain-containing protein